MEDDRKKYDITCPHCERKPQVCKSLFHEMGVENGGFARCLYCKNIIKLIYNIASDTMKATKMQVKQ